MVIVNNLCFTKNKNQTLLQNISCSLTAGRITSFLGKSGAGKTLLLKSVVGLITPTSGTITYNNTPLQDLSLKQKAETIGYVFQEFNLFGHLTALENCTGPLQIHGATQKEAHAKALNTLGMLGIEQLADRYAHQLSGGQQQRVAIARALCLNPQVLLLDEPTASLDPENTEILVTILKQLAAQGLTIGLSTQDMNFARKIVDRAYFIQAGKIIETCDTREGLERCPQLLQFME